MELKHTKLAVPFQMVEFAVKNKLIRAMAFYLYLKMHSDGKVHASSPVMADAMTETGIQDRRTVKKYLGQLLRVNWVGYNALSGNYFIRGFESIRKASGFISRQACMLYKHDLKTFSSYAPAVLICREINAQKFRKTFEKRRHQAATKNRDVAIQPAVSSKSSRQEYFGLCNAVIATILGCNRTRACVVKNTAVRDRYLLVNHHYRDLAVIGAADYHLRQQVYESNPRLRGRIRFIPINRKGQHLIKVVEQLYDEIIPQIQFRAIRKLNAPIKKAA